MSTPRRSERHNKGNPPSRYSPTPMSSPVGSDPNTGEDELNTTIVNKLVSTPIENDNSDSDQGSITSMRSHHHQSEMPALLIEINDNVGSACQTSTPVSEHLSGEATSRQEERDLAELTRLYQEANQRAVDIQISSNLIQRERDILEKELNDLRKVSQQPPQSAGPTVRADVHSPPANTPDETHQPESEVQTQMRMMFQLIQKQNESTVALADQVARLSMRCNRQSEAANSLNAIKPDKTCNTAPIYPTHVPQIDVQALQRRQAYGSWREHELPTFDGKPEDWPIFMDAFNGTFEMFDDFENMMRLRKALVGEARHRVQCLLMNQRHVDDVIKSLDIQFGRPDQLVRSQIDRVRAITPIKDHQLDRLPPFAADVNNLAVFLDTNCTRQHLANPTLMDELVLKLPINRQFDWAVEAFQIKPYPTIKDLANWLMHIARLACMVPKPLTSVSTHQTQSATRSNIPQRPSTQNSNNTRGKGSSINQINVAPHDTNPFAPNCSFCTRAHRTSKCEEFVQLCPKDRLREAEKRFWCLSCLRTGHSQAECRCKRKCELDGCRLWHNPLLHDAYEDNVQIDGPSSVNNDTNIPQSSTSATFTNDTFVGQVNVTDQPPKVENTSVLFRILPVMIHGPNNKQIKTYAMFDEGSSLTLLDADIAEELQLTGPVTTLSTECYDGTIAFEDSMTVTVEVSGTSEHRYRMAAVRTTKRLNLPRQTLKMSQLHSC